jgi:hypothetical protein
VLDQLLRIGKQAFVSFPNFAQWKIRFAHMFGGRMPVTKQLPHRWYDTPNIHHVTIDDFKSFVKERGYTIEGEWYLAGEKAARCGNGQSACRTCGIFAATAGLEAFWSRLRQFPATVPIICFSQRRRGFAREAPYRFSAPLLSDVEVSKRRREFGAKASSQTVSDSLLRDSKECAIGDSTLRGLSPCRFNLARNYAARPSARASLPVSATMLAPVSTRKVTGVPPISAVA